MRVCVPAEMMKIAAEDVVSGERHELPDLVGIQHIGTEALARAVVERAPVEPELPLIEGNADPVRLKFGRIAQQLVHHGPQTLLLLEERAVMMRAAAPVAPRSAPPRGGRLDHERIDAVAREPPGGAQPGDAPSDDDDRGAVARALVLAVAAAQAHSPATGSSAPHSAAECADERRQNGIHCEGMPNQLSQPSPIAAASG